MIRIDLNSDMGEFAEAIADGTQTALLESVTSVNIACGGHAGDEESMRATILQALARKAGIGAHPGYPDRENFGRLELDLAPEEISRTVFEQVSAFARIAEACGASIAHVKPHGALYNQAVRNEVQARAIAEGVARWNREVILVGLAGSPMLDVFRAAGFRVAAEAFADRRYEADGTLRSRRFPDALIRDPEAAAEQALDLASRGAADTICIHSDTPGSVAIAAAVAARLRGAGVDLRPLAR